MEEQVRKLIDDILDDCKIGGKKNTLTYSAYKKLDAIDKMLKKKGK